MTSEHDASPVRGELQRSTIPGYVGWTIVPPPPELPNEPAFLLSPDGRTAVRQDIAELAAFGLTSDGNTADDPAAWIVAGLETARVRRASTDGRAN